MDWGEFRKAVKDNAEPTPGYLYNTLAQWTYADRGTQNQLVAALFDKLRPPATGQPTSVHVLYKALHLIKVLCESGHPDFQKEVQTTERSATLKNYANFHGWSDPMHGDAWNEKVRHEAKAALEAAFSDRSNRRGDFTGGGGSSGSGAETAGAALSSSSAPPSSLLVAAAVGFGGYGNPHYSRAEGTGSDAFRTGEKYMGAAAHTSSNNSGGAASSFEPVGRVAEMPQANRWMQYVADMEAKHTTQPANTLLQQLSAKAKAGWNLIAEHEKMKLKDDRIYETAPKRGLAAGMLEEEGNSRGPSRATRLFAPTEPNASSSSYQPVGVPATQLDADEDAAADDGGQQQQLPPQATATSRFVFLNSSEDHNLSTAPEASPFSGDAVGRNWQEDGSTAGHGNHGSSSGSTSHDRAEPLPFRRVVQRLVSSRTTPQRVELAEFVAACQAEGDKRIASGNAGLGDQHTQEQQQQRWETQRTVFSFLDGVGGGDVGTASTNVHSPLPQSPPQRSVAADTATAVWTALAEAVEEQLHTQLPWQQRMNALCGLEALLLRCHSGPSAPAEGTTTTDSSPSLRTCGAVLRRHFAAAPEGVARNAHVAQATLRDRATRVAALLQISTDIAPPAVAQPSVSSTPSQPPPAHGTTDALNLAGMKLAGSRRRQQTTQTAEMKDIFGLATTTAPAATAPPTPPPVQTQSSSLFTGDDGTALTLRRRAPMASATARSSMATSLATEPVFPTATPSTASGVAGGPRTSAPTLDELFGGPPSAAATAGHHVPQLQTDAYDSLLLSAPSPPQQQRQRQAQPAITVLGVRASPSPTNPTSEAALDPFAPPPDSQQEPPQPPPHVYYNTYGSGHPVPATEPSSHFSMGGVATTGAAPGSVQSMNKAFAEMQRKLMSESEQAGE